MDFPGFMGKIERWLGVQLCAYCADGPAALARAEIGVSGGGRGKNGTIGQRRLATPLTDEELQMWAVKWLAEKLNCMANHVRRNGSFPDRSTWI